MARRDGHRSHRQHDASTGTFRLPAEHAVVLSRPNTPNMAATCQWIGLLGSVEDKVAEAFSHGQGVPYSAYGRFHEVMAEESQQTMVSALNEHILPLVPGLTARLDEGIDVVDVGCGAGRALIHLARRFPLSRFVGLDVSPEVIDLARREAAAARLHNLQFEVQDLAAWRPKAKFDLVTAFDIVHDQARPDEVLRNMRRALRGGGTLLMQDISGSSHVHKDMDHILAPLLYTVSTMHCMSVSLANGGPGLGAMWGKETALRMLAEAGFVNVRVESLPHDPMNFFYVSTVRAMP